MKVETVEVKTFNPVRITLETQDEVDRLFAILNFAPIEEAVDLNEDNWDFLYSELKKYKTDCYLKYHSKLDGSIQRR